MVSQKCSGKFGDNSAKYELQGGPKTDTQFYFLG